jgi:hypothetical protein
MKTGAELIAEERQRQITQEGWDEKNDDGHTCRELLYGAQSYIQSVLAPDSIPESKRRYILSMHWPAQWNPSWFKPTTPIRDLVKAGALIAAEIDRLQRL